MRVLLMILALISFTGTAFAQAYDNEVAASRMNRDGDYPWDPSEQQYIKMPPRQKIVQYNRDLARYEVTQQNKAWAAWRAMTPDQKRRFIAHHPEAFAPGGIYYQY